MVLAATSFAAPPRYDHVVVVIEENHSLAQIIGNRTSAPYINQLADGGVGFTSIFALTHPSQPNYLEFFSGSTQGVVDNLKPRNADGTNRYPFSTANLGAELIGAGSSFVGYSEDLPAAGDRDTSSVVVNGSALYMRKHNPWANWQDARPADDSVPVPPPNQLPWTTNQPFTAFPADFTQLPVVSIVVPNQQNDMHDGTVKMADDWLVANISAYAEWAKTHNSLLIVTWDEDAGQAGNRIPTIFYGANLKPGVNDNTWTLHNLQRTLAEMYGVTAHAGAAAQVQRIAGVFAGDLPVARAVFRQGAAGYAGTHDTQVRADQANTAFGTATPLTVDLDAGGAGFPSQALVRFDNLNGAVPPVAPILSAKLILTTGSNSANNDASTTVNSLHRMLVDWDESATWNTLAGGITADGLEAAATPTFSLVPRTLGAPAIFDVTADLQRWLRDGVANQGWALLPADIDGWRFSSAEEVNTTLRPVLEVEYAASLMEFSAATYSRDEALGGSVTITVTRAGWIDAAVTVNYATADGTATAGADYTAASGTLSWPAGDATPRFFTVPIATDSLVEADETVLLTLSAPTGAAVLSGRANAPFTIRETAFNNWRAAKFGVDANTPEIAGETADPDGDTQDNLREFTAGTEPLDPASRFVATAGVAPMGGVRIHFTAQPGRGYTIQFKTDLTDPAWQNLANVATAATVREIDADDPIGANTQRFYRVVTPPAP